MKMRMRLNREREFSISKVVGSDVRQRVIDFCTLHQKEPMKKIEIPLLGDTPETIFDSPQYAGFCKGWELEDFSTMHNAANYMTHRATHNLGLHCT